MPVLGMAQDTGRLISWLKVEGAVVVEGEPIMEVETDKATVEIEAAGSGTLGGVRAQEGDEVPVGQVIAWILEPGESIPEETTPQKGGREEAPGIAPKAEAKVITSAASPVAQKMAAEHGIDLALVKAAGDRIQKADVLAYIKTQSGKEMGARLAPASPKARRLAAEREIDITSITGAGPDGAVLVDDILAIESKTPHMTSLTLSTVWQRMAERVTKSWNSAPHFYLIREVNASRLVAWRTQAKERTGQRITYTDLLIRLVSAALSQHPQANAAWNDGEILLNDEINIGLAMAVDEGLIVPVIHQADQLSLSQIAIRRDELVELARNGKLRLEDLQGGTFTISNLGMYGVDIFNAILNPPQSAILAVGRIAERVVPVNGQPAVQPMMIISVSYDHRAIDGARGAQFLETLADLIEEPLTLLD
ncbi:MAG: dihydrolipoamide acetyltransferase family protein [Anaerolineales bacterium]